MRTLHLLSQILSPHKQTLRTSISAATPRRTRTACTMRCLQHPLPLPPQPAAHGHDRRPRKANIFPVERTKSLEAAGRAYHFTPTRSGRVGHRQHCRSLPDLVLPSPNTPSTALLPARTAARSAHLGAIKRGVGDPSVSNGWTGAAHSASVGWSGGDMKGLLAATSHMSAREWLN